MWALLWFGLAGCEEQSPREILDARGIVVNGESLRHATAADQVEVVSLLTQVGVLPDESRDEGGGTPLMLAARGGFTELVERLIPHCRNLDLVDGHGMTALCYAIGDGHLGIAEALLEAGAKVDVGSHLKQPLLVTAVMQSQLPAVELLLAHGAKAGLEDALLIAVSEGKAGLVEELIRAGAAPDARPDLQMPALNLAVENGDSESLGLLLAAGANPNLRDAGGLSALGYAIGSRDGVLLSRLLSAGADPELPCQDELTAMEAGVIAGDASIVEKLLTEARAVIHPRLLTAALDRGSPQLLAVLLDHGADIEAQDSDGDTLVTRAIRSGDVEQLRLLLRRGARVDAKCREGQSLLALATALKQAECVAALIEAGADPNQQLSAPISKGYRDLVGSKTFSFYATRDSRFTPIMVAASHGHADTLRALLKHGASKGRATKGYERYPISFAAEAGHIEAQQLLVGYDPQEREDHFKIVITLSTQRAVMYKNGEVYKSSKVSTGKSGYRTPTGEYVVTHKHRTWTSTLYDAAMPYFMRFSCKAFGTHVGYVPNYPASHGCIRMPQANAKEFFETAPLGTPVSIVE